MIKHRILYIPNGAYVTFMWYRGNDNTITENCDCCSYSITSPRTPEKIVDAICSWSSVDSFFDRNKIPWPVSKEEFEIIEIEVEE